MVFLLLTSCSHRPLEANKPLKIVVANDMHYAHQRIIGDHPRSQDLTTKADGKQINFLSEIMEAFVEDVNELNPDVVILNGDLVFNGEKKNHQYFEGLISKIKAQVLINPGNHDIDSPHAISINNDSSSRLATVDQNQFQQIYKNHGYKQARSKDLYSLSYLYELSDSLHILMLDSRCDRSCENINHGQIKSETMQWVEDQLKESEDKQARVIVAAHHSVLIHYPRLRTGFTINNHEQLIELLNKYNVQLALTGHIHVQHISQENDLVDIATQSLALYKNQYGVIDIDGNELTYQTHSVDVSNFAKKKGYTNPSLLDFEKTTLDTITDVNYRRTAFRLYDDMFITNEEDLLSIASYDAKIKAYYFSGQLHEHVNEFRNDEEFNRLVKKYPQDTQTMVSNLDYFGNKDQRKIKIKLK